MRQAFEIARRSRAAGDHPFGSVLADGEGKLLMEQGNGYTSEGGDRTAHAERLLASRAARAYDLTFLARCTLYTSAEPCAMCAGAIYWAGIGRVVYGQTEKALKAQTGAHEENPTLDLPCDIVFAAGQRPTEVVGPLLEDEAAQLQADFWKARRSRTSRLFVSRTSEPSLSTRAKREAGVLSASVRSQRAWRQRANTRNPVVSPTTVMCPLQGATSSRWTTSPARSCLDSPSDVVIENTPAATVSS